MRKCLHTTGVPSPHVPHSMNTRKCSEKNPLKKLGCLCYLLHTKCYEYQVTACVCFKLRLFTCIRVLCLTRGLVKFSLAAGSEEIGWGLTTSGTFSFSTTGLLLSAIKITKITQMEWHVLHPLITSFSLRPRIIYPRNFPPYVTPIFHKRANQYIFNRTESGTSFDSGYTRWALSHRSCTCDQI